MSRLAFAALVAVISSGSANADSLVISDAWARATPPGAVTAAAYLNIRNQDNADRLVGARSAAAREVQIHTTIREGAMMKMVQLDALPIPGGRETTLGPGGNHLMLVDIEQPLRPGEVVAMTLTFENAGDRVVTFPIRDARAVQQ
jgi:copper(I)-binding protein